MVRKKSEDNESTENDSGRPLTRMQTAFAFNVADHPEWSGAKCAIEAGASEVSAHVQSSRWLKNDNIIKLIDRRRQEVAVSSGITKEWWLRRHAELASVNPRDLYDSAGFLRPLSELPEVLCKAIKKIKTREIFSGDGDQKGVIGFVREIELLDPQRSLEALERHGGWGKTIHEHTGSITVIASPLDEKL